MVERRQGHPEDESPETTLIRLRAQNFSGAGSLLSSAITRRIMEQPSERRSFAQDMFASRLELGIPGAPHKYERIRQEEGFEVELPNEYFAYYSFRRDVHPTMSSLWLAVVVLPDLGRKSEPKDSNIATAIDSSPYIDPRNDLDNGPDGYVFRYRIVPGDYFHLESDLEAVVRDAESKTFEVEKVLPQGTILIPRYEPLALAGKIELVSLLTGKPLDDIKAAPNEKIADEMLIWELLNLPADHRDSIVLR